MKKATALVALACLMFSGMRSYAQADVTSIYTVPTQPTSCDSIGVYATVVLQATNYAMVNFSSTVVGNQLILHVDYLSGFVTLPGPITVTLTDNFPPQAAGNYHIRVSASLDGAFQDSLGSNIQVWNCCSADAILITNATKDSLCAGQSLNLSSASTGATSQAWYFNGSPLGTATTASVVPTGSGPQTVKLVAYGAGCADSAERSIYILPQPMVNLGQDTTFCAGDSIQLSVAANAGTVLWNTGSTDPSIWVKNPGNYWASITNTAGCIGSDTLAVDTTTCGVGLGEDPQAFLELYPNPAKEEIAIKSHGGSLKDLVLVNAHGQVIRRFKLSGSAVEKLKLHQIAPGTYWLQGLWDGKPFAKQLLITP